MPRMPMGGDRHDSTPARCVAALAGVMACAVLLVGLAHALSAPPGGMEGRVPLPASGVEGPSGIGPPPLEGDPTVLPGVMSVTDAVPSEGGWVILDGRSARWHRLDGEGRVLVSAGRRGRGPGEMENPAALGIVGDTVVVVERTLGTVERFLLDGTPVGRLHLPSGGCTVGWVRRMAVAGGVPYLLRECQDAATGGSLLVVQRLEGGAGGSGEDPAIIASRPWRDASGMVPYRPGIPILAGGVDRLLFGDALDNCLDDILDLASPLPRPCHPDPPRLPLDAGERAALESARRALSGSGIRLEEPRYRPPFDDVFLLPEGGVVLRTVLEGEGRRLDMMRPGAPPRALLESATPHARVGPHSILLSGDNVDGTWIRILPLP